MRSAIPITTLFLDIGDVLLTDGWDHQARKQAATTFKLAFADMEERHNITFETFEAWLSSTKSDRSPERGFAVSCSLNLGPAPG